MHTLVHNVRSRYGGEIRDRRCAKLLEAAWNYRRRGYFRHTRRYAKAVLEEKSTNEDFIASAILLAAEAAFGLGEICKTLVELDRLKMTCPNVMSSNPTINQKSQLLLATIQVMVGADQLGEEILNNDPKLLESKIDIVVPQLTVAAGEWHRARRRLMLQRHPELSKWFETKVHYGTRLCILAIGLTLLQFIIAVSISQYGWLALLFAASTVGATCAYGFQALNHDISHAGINNPLHFVSMVMSSSLCNFPWAMYYHYFHSRHHAYTGMDEDRDGDILFHPWHGPPHIELRRRSDSWQSLHFVVCRWGGTVNYAVESVSSGSTVSTLCRIDFSKGFALRLTWTAISSLFLFPMFLIRKALLDVTHIPLVEYEGFMLLSHFLVFRYGGLMGVVYLALSCMFSLGAFCHPYFGFWLIQHQVVHRVPKSSRLVTLLGRIRMTSVIQPTKAYTGNSIWNLLNYGELWHVAHHDFPMIPAWYYPAVHETAPEFFDCLESETSILQAVWDWVDTPDSEVWMKNQGDFANRNAFLHALEVRYRDFYRDTRETSQMDLQDFTNITSWQSPIHACGACNGIFRPKGPLVYAVVVTCRNCYESVACHTSCSGHMVACKSCTLPWETSKPPRAIQCIPSHIATCLLRGPCRECLEISRSTKAFSSSSKIDYPRPYVSSSHVKTI